MQRYSTTSLYNNYIGISLIDILLVFALISLLAGLSAPNITKFISSYKLRIAVSDLSSFIHKSKVIAAKDNISVTIDFKPINFIGYTIKDSNDKLIVAVSFNGCRNQHIKLNRCYGGNILYKKPHTEEDNQSETLTIKPNGLSSRGFAYITDQGKNKFYRVGIVSAAGIVGVEKWNGLQWE